VTLHGTPGPHENFLKLASTAKPATN